jgi:mevalonate pyrophosphate decarboxylase
MSLGWRPARRPNPGELPDSNRYLPKIARVACGNSCRSHIDGYLRAWLFTRGERGATSDCAPNQERASCTLACVSHLELWESVTCQWIQHFPG